MIRSNQLSQVEKMTQADRWIKVGPEALPVHLSKVDAFIAAENDVDRVIYDADAKRWLSAHGGAIYPAGAITYWRQGSRPQEERG